MSVRWLAGAVAISLVFAACDRGPAFEMLTPPGQPDQLSQTYWKLADFALTERSGRTVSLADLGGKVWVADFFYSTCPGPCPMLTSRLGELQNHFGGDERIRLVSISSDPAKDTPDVLGQYAQRFHAGEHWLFLTGTKAAIHSLARDGFKLPIAEEPGAAEPIIHSTRLILIDQTGAIRGLYESADASSTAQLVRDVRRLLDAPP